MVVVNPEDVLLSLDGHATRIWCLFLERLPAVAGHVREHVNLLHAVIDGDEGTAARLAGEHVIGFEAAIRQLL